MVILASEDIGNADPHALPIAVAAAHAVEHVGLPEGQFALAQAAIYLSLAPEVGRRQAGDRRGPRAHPRRRRRAPARRAAVGRLPGRRRARPRHRLRLPARPPGPRERPGAPAGGPRGPALLPPRRGGGRAARAARAHPGGARAALMAVHPLAARAFGARGRGLRARPAGMAGGRRRLPARPLRRRRTVLDLAAGTGKLTQVLARARRRRDRGRAARRHAPRAGARACPQVRALAGTAEAIPLPDGAVDAVFVAEAFHWFDLPRAVAELARVLRPGGGLAVLWNTSGDEGSSTWFDELHAIVRRAPRRSATPPGRERAPWREALEADGRFEPLQDEEATHEQRTDRDGAGGDDRLVQLHRRPARRPPRRRARRRAARCSSATASTRSRSPTRR